MVCCCCMFLLLATSCKKDEDPRFQVSSTSINSDAYTGGGTLKALYSTDAGNNYTEELPTGLLAGSIVLVKINNGTEDLTADNFSFDWSGSSVVPAVTDGAIASFTIASSALTIEVTVADIVDLMGVKSDTGGLYRIDRGTGDTTLVGSITLAGAALPKLRGMVYNYNDNTLYTSATADGSGKLYSLNPATLEATTINENPGDDWYGISDLLITADNTILSNLWYKNATESGLAYFTTAGVTTNVGDRILFNPSICCGKALVYGASESELITTADNLEVYSSTLAGALTLLTTAVPEGFAAGAALSQIKNLVKDTDGKIYAIAFDDTNDTTYLAELIIEESKLIFIKQLGTNKSNGFNALCWVPRHAL